MNINRRFLSRTGGVKLFPLPLLISFIFLVSFPVIAADYSIRSVLIDARLNSDGSMDIREERTYYFDGAFTYATYSLPLEGTGGIADFRVSEEGRPYGSAESKEPGSYMASTQGNALEAIWYYSAENEQRTFILEFRVLDLVKKYEDVAVLYYKFVGTGWEKSSQHVRVRITPPLDAGAEEVRAWAHGPLWGSVEIHDHGVVVADIDNLPYRDFWEVRALYPTELFSGALSLPEVVLPDIVEEERTWAEEANRIRQEVQRKTAARESRKRHGKWLAIIVGIGGILAWWNLYNACGRRPKTSLPGKIYSDIPSQTPPALLSYMLYNKTVAGGALVGTLLDLARRRFVTIKELDEAERRKKRKKPMYALEFHRDFFNSNSSTMLDYERSLLLFIFDDLAGGGDEIDFKTINKRHTKFVKFFQRWRKQVKEEGKTRNYFNVESERATNKSLIMSAFLFIMTILAAIFIEEWALPVGLATLLVFVLSFTIFHREAEVEREARQWQGLKRYLQKYYFREADRTEFLKNVDLFLVYGVVLALSKKITKTMAELIPGDQYATFVPWYAYSARGEVFSPAAFGEAMSSLVATVTSTVSSAAGTGGGASAGGGGGAGGSGGGAG